MLERLTIQNYALIESLDIEFPDGLVIMTGETGAGKSVLLGAVSLLGGGKADPSILRDESRNCVVEAVFNTGGQQKILRRVVSPSLRSRFFIDDEPVNAAAMAEESVSLLDIHSQHSNLMLGSRDFQMKMLDAFCGNSSLLEDYQKEYFSARKTAQALEDLELKIEQAETDRGQRMADLAKLEEADLKEGELEELEQEQSRLENAELLTENSMNAASLLDGEESSVIRGIREASRNLEKIALYAPDLEPLAARLESCRIECKDIASDIQRFASGIAISPGRLQQIGQRLDTIYSLMRRFGCKDIAGLVDLRESLKKSESDMESLSQQKQMLHKEMERHLVQREMLANKLHSSRKKGAALMQKMLVSKIRDLEMPFAEFSIEVSDAGDFCPDGQDDLQMLFSANPKEKMQQVGKIASGGELSRLMLCLKGLMANYMKMPTVFFDEIDVGVSGSVADKMGRRIVEMGNNMQVVAITHLPQVASKGNAHLLVYKDKCRDGRSVIRLKKLEGQERVMEIARLLSGEKTTEQAVANAKVLLSEKVG